MNRFVHRLAMAGLLLSVACSSSSGSATVLGMTFTLQGVVADAVNGQRLGGGDLQLFLVQGATIRGPTRLISNTNDPLAGEYAFAGIPVEFNLSDNLWKLVVIKGGYQRFESEFNLKATAGTVVDTVYSKIGNVYLFPVNTKSPDYTITATYNGKPVPNATVQLDPISASNTGTFVTGGAADTLPATNGYVVSLSQTTDPTGKAVFPGASLAVGAAYRVTILPVAFTDSAGTTVQLGTFNPGGLGVVGFVAGLGATAIPVAMSNLTPGGALLYLTSASNRATGQLAADGKLTITFSAPFTVTNLINFGATLRLASGTPPTAALSNAQPVIATQPDPQTLVLTPNYTTQPAAGDRGLSITYSNGTALIVPKDYPAFSSPLFGFLSFSDGTNVSGLVNITGP